ncbi:putative histidine kinase HHK19p, partial [Aureobasidium melanogenum]
CVEAREIERRKASERAREEAEINLRELQLREREAILANSRMKSVLAIADTIDVGFFDYLPTGELIEGNNAFYELSGYPKDPELNKQFTFLDYCMPEDAEMVMGKWSWLMTGKPTTFDMRHVLWKNGTTTGQWVQAACTPVFDDAGNIISVSGCTTNISAQKLAQENAFKRAEALEQVRLSQARLLQFTDNAPIGIVIRGSCDTPMYTNNSWFDITGLPKTAASDVDILSVCYPDDLPMIMEKRKEIMEQKKAVEFRTRLKKTWSSVDGSFKGQAWVSIIGFPEFSEDGTLSRMMSLWTDISHSQFSEHMQRKRLEEAIEAKKRTEAFIDITSHEIRNPLGATVHCADLLKESLAEMRQLIDTLEKEKADDNSSQRIRARLEEHLNGGTEAVDTIISCSMHQRKIADDILSLSKLDS